MMEALSLSMFFQYFIGCTNQNSIKYLFVELTLNKNGFQNSWDVILSSTRRAVKMCGLMHNQGNTNQAESQIRDNYWHFSDQPTSGWLEAVKKRVECKI